MKNGTETATLKINIEPELTKARAQLNEFSAFLKKNLKAPDSDYGKQLTSSLTEAYSALNKLSKAANSDFVSKRDLDQLNQVNKLIQEIYGDVVKVSSQGRGDASLFKLDEGTLQQLTTLEQRLQALKASASTAVSSVDFTEIRNTFQELINLYPQLPFDAIEKRLIAISQAAKSNNLEEYIKQIQAFNTQANKANAGEQWKTINTLLQQQWAQLSQTINGTNKEIELNKTKIQELSGQNIQSIVDQFDQFIEKASGMKKTLAEVGKNAYQTGQQMNSMSHQINQVINRIAQFSSITGIINIVRRVIRSAVEDVKELDEAMNSIAVVTDYTTAELWDQVDAYANLAQEMGVTLTGTYEVQKLYYQQGRDTADVTALTTETLKLARIAGLEYADATDAMTVALNAFKIEAEDSSSVVDVYSNLASHAAVSQSELATAMSKVASMASSVGMSLESSSAFLTQIIETTR